MTLTRFRLPSNAGLFKSCKCLVGVYFEPCRRQSTDSYQQQKPSRDAKNQVRRVIPAMLAFGTGLASWIAYNNWKKSHLFALKPESQFREFGEFKRSLKSYTESEVAEHNSPEKRVWISFKDGVYDITDFIKEHPGGDKILMAAGGAVDPFWQLYAVHLNEQVLEILEKYRIGNLKRDKQSVVKTDDPYSTDPKRHPALTPRSLKPCNAEPPLEVLVQSFYTPNDLFYVRNHLPVPVVNPDEYRLEIEGFGLKKEWVFTLEDLKKKFPKKSVAVAIQCAGNRRSEMNKVQEVKGLSWGAAAISNAVWSGASLVDVLQFCGLDFDNPNIKHVQFEGLDLDPAAMPYGASVPADKALDPKSMMLLAYEMNGEEIPRDHGYPVRFVAPGIVGARNVKWLGKIVLSDEESHSQWQRRDYKGFSPNVNWTNVDFESAPSIQELPIQSAICIPQDGEVLKPDANGCITVKGYAYSGGGRKVVRVDVSLDNGKTWITANLKKDDETSAESYAWKLWEVTTPVPKSEKELVIICKAVDSSYNVQPETFAPIWNFRGVLSNAWHRITVKVDNV